MTLHWIRPAAPLLVGATLGAVGHARVDQRRHVEPAPVASTLAVPECECPAPAVVTRYVNAAAPDVGHWVAGVEGVVQSDDGAPLSGSVTASDGRESISVDTDEEGRFSIDLPPATWELTATVSDDDGDDHEGEPASDLTLSPGERLQGLTLQVTMPAKQPAPDEPSPSSEATLEEEAARMAEAQRVAECTEACQQTNPRDSLSASCNAEIDRAFAAREACQSACGNQ
jgi:hypothetical protein